MAIRSSVRWDHFSLCVTHDVFVCRVSMHGRFFFTFVFSLGCFYRSVSNPIKSDDSPKELFKAQRELFKTQRELFKTQGVIKGNSSFIVRCKKNCEEVRKETAVVTVSGEIMRLVFKPRPH